MWIAAWLTEESVSEETVWLELIERGFEQAFLLELVVVRVGQGAEFLRLHAVSGGCSVQAFWNHTSSFRNSM